MSFFKGSLPFLNVVIAYFSAITSSFVNDAIALEDPMFAGGLEHV